MKKTIKFFVVLALMAVSFYGGAYIVASSQQEGEGVIVGAIEHALRDTNSQPIIIIVPEDSLWEKAKLKLGFDLPEREMVFLSTTQVEKLFGLGTPEGPGFVRKTIEWTTDKYQLSKEKTVDAYQWVKGKITSE
jgi:hypothetical protein